MKWCGVHLRCSSLRLLEPLVIRVVFTVSSFPCQVLPLHSCQELVMRLV